MKGLRSTIAVAVLLAAASMATAPPVQAATLEVSQVSAPDSVRLELQHAVPAVAMDTFVVELTPPATSAIEILPARGGGTVSDPGFAAALARSSNERVLPDAMRVDQRPRARSPGLPSPCDGLGVSSLRTTPLRV